MPPGSGDFDGGGRGMNGKTCCPARERGKMCPASARCAARRTRQGRIDPNWPGTADKISGWRRWPRRAWGSRTRRAGSLSISAWTSHLCSPRERLIACAAAAYVRRPPTSSISSGPIAAGAWQRPPQTAARPAMKAVVDRRPRTIERRQSRRRQSAASTRITPFRIRRSSSRCTPGLVPWQQRLDPRRSGDHGADIQAPSFSGGKRVQAENQWLD